MSERVSQEFEAKLQEVGEKYAHLVQPRRTEQAPLKEFKLAPDPVNHPQHYTAHPSGIECIQVTEHMGFNLGNAIKYVWRADLKGSSIEDLRKAIWYIDREIQKREKP